MCDIYRGRVGGGSHPDFLRIKLSNPNFHENNRFSLNSCKISRKLHLKAILYQYTDKPALKGTCIYIYIQYPYIVGKYI